MRHLVLSALAFPLLALSHAQAGEYLSNKGERGYNKSQFYKDYSKKDESGKKGWQRPPMKDPVLVKEIGFKAELSGGKVTASWKKYKRDDFKYYKLMKSDKNPDPVYPEDSAIFATDKPDQTSQEDWNLSPGTWYYRLCILTHGGDRWVSPVVALKIGEEGGKPSEPPSSKDFE
jgi:hypothetical protein